VSLKDKLKRLLDLLFGADPIVSKPDPAVPGPVFPDSKGVLESWFEEFNHDWFKGTLPGEPEKDWAPMDSPEWTAIVNGEKRLPAGATVRFMSGLSRAPQGALVPTGFPIIHYVKFVSEDSGKTVLVSITNDQVKEEGYQPFPDFAHVQHSPRNSGPKVDGCAVAMRLNPDLGRGTLSYWAESAFAGPSPTVKIEVGRKK